LQLVEIINPITSQYLLSNILDTTSEDSKDHTCSAELLFDR